MFWLVLGLAGWLVAVFFKSGHGWVLTNFYLVFLFFFFFLLSAGSQKNEKIK